MISDGSSVSIKFVAQHFDAERDEGWHTHEWEVTIWRKATPWSDGRDYLELANKFLDAALIKHLDGTTQQIRNHLWSNEALAKYFLKLKDTVGVEVKRDDFGARFFRDRA